MLSAASKNCFEWSKLRLARFPLPNKKNPSTPSSPNTHTYTHTIFIPTTCPWLALHEISSTSNASLCLLSQKSFPPDLPNLSKHVRCAQNLNTTVQTDLKYPLPIISYSGAPSFQRIS